MTASGDSGGERNEVHSARPWFPLITYEGVFANAFILLTGGAFLTGAALMFGANDFEIGLLAAIPFLAQMAQMFSAVIIDQTGKRKAITVWSLAFSRQIWWLLLPVLLLAGKGQLYILIGIVAVSSVANMIASPGWMSWVADLVPDRLRGRYFGRRNAVISVSTITATVGGGVVLDKFRAIDLEHVGFFVIFAVACICALVALIIMTKTPDHRSQKSDQPFAWAYILEPLKDRSFRHLLAVFFFWNIAIGISAAFFVPHMLNNLKMSFTLISVYGTLATMVAIILYRPWGVIIDRFGSKPVIVLCAFAIGFVPLIWLIPRPGYLGILWFEALFTGVIWSGFNLASFNIPIANSPKEGRPIYLAMFAVIAGIGFFAASVLGGTIAEHLRGLHHPWGKQTIVNYHVLFVISSIFRVLAASFMITFHEPREKSFPVMIQFMGYAILRRLSFGRQLFPWASRLESGAAFGKGISQPLLPPRLFANSS